MKPPAKKRAELVILCRRLRRLRLEGMRTSAGGGQNAGGAGVVSGRNRVEDGPDPCGTGVGSPVKPGRGPVGNRAAGTAKHNDLVTVR